MVRRDGNSATLKTVVMMNEVVRVEIPVQEATAVALADEGRRQAIGRLVDSIVRSGPGHPLAVLFAATAAEAQAAGVTDAVIDAELTAYNAERRG